jgi:hypothetical protein
MEKPNNSPEKTSGMAVGPESCSSNRAKGNFIDAPADDDILLGRGRPFQTHPGNEWMLELAKQHKDLYQKLPKEKKRPIIEELLQTIREQNRRFLRRVEGEKYWEEVSDDIASEKMSHALRAKKEKRTSRARTAISREVQQANSSLDANIAILSQFRAHQLLPGGSTHIGMPIHHPAAAQIPSITSLQPDLSLLWGADTAGLIPRRNQLYLDSLRAPSSNNAGYAIGNHGASLEQLAHSQGIENPRQRRELEEAILRSSMASLQPPFMPGYFPWFNP